MLQEISKFHSTFCNAEILIYPAQEMHNEMWNYMHTGNVNEM